MNGRFFFLTFVCGWLFFLLVLLVFLFLLIILNIFFFVFFVSLVPPGIQTTSDLVCSVLGLVWLRTSLFIYLPCGCRARSELICVVGRHDIRFCRIQIVFYSWLTQNGFAIFLFGSQFHFFFGILFPFNFFLFFLSHFFEFFSFFFHFFTFVADESYYELECYLLCNQYFIYNSTQDINVGDIRVCVCVCVFEYVLSLKLVHSQFVRNSFQSPSILCVNQTIFCVNFTH